MGECIFCSSQDELTPATFGDISTHVCQVCLEEWALFGQKRREESDG